MYVLQKKKKLGTTFLNRVTSKRANHIYEVCVSNSTILLVLLFFVGDLYAFIMLLFVHPMCLKCIFQSQWQLNRVWPQYYLLFSRNVSEHGGRAGEWVPAGLALIFSLRNNNHMGRLASTTVRLSLWGNLFFWTH